MHLDEFRNICLGFPSVWEDLPFGPDTLVFKVGKKMFCAIGLDSIEPSAGLKCDPDRSLELREQYEGITTGPYLNKKHWNYVRLQSDVPDSLIGELARHSYNLVVAGMTKTARGSLRS